MKKILRDTILQSTDLFKVKPYFLSDEFSLVDATIAPVLWRLPLLRDRSAAAGPADREVRTVVVLAPRLPRGPVGARAGDAAVSATGKGAAQAPLPAARHASMDRECGNTPHVIVDAGRQGAEVPRAYVKDGKIVLNLSEGATQRLRLGNEEVEFDARFAGVIHHVRFPVSAVLGIYARETGEGMVFSEQDLGPEPPSRPKTAEEGGCAPPAAEGGQVNRASRVAGGGSASALARCRRAQPARRARSRAMRARSPACSTAVFSRSPLSSRASASSPSSMTTVILIRIKIAYSSCGLSMHNTSRAQRIERVGL